LLEHAVKAVAPSIVLVSVVRDDPSGGGSIEASGTGFAVLEEGGIATAYHLVRKAREIRVKGLGWSGAVPATLIRKDERADLALLRILGDKLSPAPLQRGEPGGLDDDVAIGREVAYMGFPHTDVFDPPLLMTSRAIVGNRYRMREVDWLVLDTVLSPGTSGGPLFTCDTGKVIGVIGARFDPERARRRLSGPLPEGFTSGRPSVSSIAFAAPIARLKALLDDS
jgi:S1-C subfamily serine protease